MENSVEIIAENEEVKEVNDVIEVKSDRGFKCTIEKDALMDVELFDDLVALENGDVSNLTKICNTLLGDEQRKEFYEFLRNEKGRILFTTLASELMSIFKNAGEVTKNS